MLALEMPKVTVTHISYRDLLNMGEPFGNYQKPSRFDTRKHGPAVALVGAFSTISAGVAMFETSMLLGGMMIAGGVMSGLGALTGNKTLSTLGMGLGLAGGIGSAFTQVGTDGAMTFANPFSEGYEFSSSVMGKGFSKAGEFVKDITGGGAEGAATAGQGVTNNIVEGAKGVGSFGNDLTGELTGPTIESELTKNTLTGGYDALSGTERLIQKGSGMLGALGDAATEAVTGSASGSSPNMMTGLLNNKLVSAAIGGASDAYSTNQQIEATKGTRDANEALTRAQTEQSQAQTDRLKQQMTNMNSQNINVNSGLSFNQGQQPVNAQTQTNGAPAGKVAAIVNNQVVYVTPEELQAMQAQQQQQINQQAQQQGLLNTRMA